MLSCQFFLNITFGFACSLKSGSGKFEKGELFADADDNIT